LPSANVQSILVNGVVATISGSVFTATVPLQTGVNKILATATSTDSDCSPVHHEVTLIRQGGGICEFLLPTDAVTISLPTSGTVFTTNTIQLTGTAATGVLSVTVKVN
jgi:hypothetical protein